MVYLIKDRQRFDFVFLKHVRKDLRKLSPETVNHIIFCIENRLTFDPFSLSKPLRGNLKGRWRYRVGDYRIIFYVEDSMIYVTQIDHRSTIYKA